jgi:hypothetical protein
LMCRDKCPLLSAVNSVKYHGANSCRLADNIRLVP